MLAGRDSEFAPSDAELDAAWAAGVRVWGCYFAGPNVANGWSDADILRVKAKGFVVIAFCSGYADPAAMGARARALGVLCCLDDESGMRPDGDWVEGWCATAGAGLYGNGSFHYNAQGIRPAAFHIFAGYFGYDPGATWPNFDARPPTPCGWQWLGGHIEFGGNVDSAWYDDSFSLAFGSAGHSLTGLARRGQGEDSSLAILAHPTVTDRFDLVVISADGSINRIWGTTAQLESGQGLGTQPWHTPPTSGKWVAGSLSASYYNDPAAMRLVVTAVRDTDGAIFIREIAEDNTYDSGWKPVQVGAAVATAAMLAAGAPGPQGPQGVPGPTGPQGPAGADGAPGVVPPGTAFTLNLTGRTV